MDQLDYQLIVELQKNSRRSNRQLAQVIGVSEATIRRRINDLTKSGLIELTAIPEPAKVGNSTHAFMYLQVELSKINKVAKELAKYPEVHYVGICSGVSNLLITVMLSSPLELSEFITLKLSRIPGIIRTDTSLHLRYEKRTFGWLQPGFAPQ